MKKKKKVNKFWFCAALALRGKLAIYHDGDICEIKKAHCPKEKPLS